MDDEQRSLPGAGPREEIEGPRMGDSPSPRGGGQGAAGRPALKRDKILKSLRRDQGKLLNPPTAPFTSINNAYDSLLPYHLFRIPTYDDLIYLRVKRRSKEENRNVAKSIDKMIEIVIGAEEGDELRIMEERLRVEEERYYLGKTLDYKKSKIKPIEEMIGKELTNMRE